MGTHNGYKPKFGKQRLPLLSKVEVASPCPEKWAAMSGDDRSRSCDLCRKEVHNLSAMNAQEVEAFLAATRGQDVCVTYYRRRDGKIMTSDCFPGKKRQAKRRQRSALLAVGGSLLAAGCGSDEPHAHVLGEMVLVEHSSQGSDGNESGSHDTEGGDRATDEGQPGADADGQMILGEIAMTDDASEHVCDASCDHGHEDAPESDGGDRQRDSAAEEDLRRTLGGMVLR